MLLSTVLHIEHRQGAHWQIGFAIGCSRVKVPPQQFLRLANLNFAIGSIGGRKELLIFRLLRKQLQESLHFLVQLWILECARSLAEDEEGLGAAAAVDLSVLGIAATLHLS